MGSVAVPLIATRQIRKVWELEVATNGSNVVRFKTNGQWSEYDVNSLTWREFT